MTARIITLALAPGLLVVIGARPGMGKARQGRTGDVNFGYIGEQTRFEDWTEPPPRAAKGSFE